MVAPALKIKSEKTTMNRNEFHGRDAMRNEEVSYFKRDRQMGFVRDVEKVLKSYRNYKPDRVLLGSLLRQRSDFSIEEFYSRNIVQDMIDYFQAGITQKHMQMNVDFMDLIRKVFMMFTEKHKAQFGGMLVKRWQSFDTDYTPYFESISRNFDTILMGALEKVVRRRGEEMEEGVVNAIRWSIILSPPTTLRKLFMKCLEQPHIINRIIVMCRNIPELFYENKLKMWNSQFEVKLPKEFLLVAVLRRLIFDGRAKLTRAQHWDNLETLVVALTTPGPNGRSLIDTCHVGELMFTELSNPNRTPLKSVEVIARIAARVLHLTNEIPFSVVYATSRRDQPKDGVFLTPTIIDLMIRLFREFDGVSKEMMKSTKSVLKSLGKRLSETRVTFLYETQKQMIEEDFRELPWYMEFSMQTWFSGPLELVRRRVHAAIYDVLPETEKRHYIRGAEFESDENGAVLSPVDAYFTALFELALFDVKMAMDQLNVGTTLDFRGFDAEETLVQALEICNGHKLAVDQKETFRLSAFFRASIQVIRGRVTEREARGIVAKLLSQFPRPAPREPSVQPAELVYPSVILSALDEILPTPFQWPECQFKPSALKHDDRKARDNHMAKLRVKVAERESARAALVRKKWEDEGAYDEPCEWKHALLLEKQLDEEDDGDDDDDGESSSSGLEKLKIYTGNWWKRRGGAVREIVTSSGGLVDANNNVERPRASDGKKKTNDSSQTDRKFGDVEMEASRKEKEAKEATENCEW